MISRTPNQPQPESESPLQTAPCSTAIAPALIVIETRQSIPLPPIATVQLGRRDEEQRHFPHVDLAEYGGVMCGVSRRHACVHRAGDMLYIEDLGSTNGTLLNGTRLLPAQLYPLEHGDMLQLGELQLAVTFFGA